jgi:hypothetical protein
VVVEPAVLRPSVDAEVGGEPTIAAEMDGESSAGADMASW